MWWKTLAKFAQCLFKSVFAESAIGLALVFCIIMPEQRCDDFSFKPWVFTSRLIQPLWNWLVPKLTISKTVPFTVFSFVLGSYHYCRWGFGCGYNHAKTFVWVTIDPEGTCLRDNGWAENVRVVWPSVKVLCKLHCNICKAHLSFHTYLLDIVKNHHNNVRIYFLVLCTKGT